MSDSSESGGVQPARPWSAPKARPTVWFASTGQDVVDLQQILERCGVYSVADGDAEGVFGRDTESAVRAFQSAQGLSSSAVVDGLTWFALDATDPGR